MQYLLLSRHGNTFAQGNKVVWVGSKNDLPLVASGIEQATNLAQVLLDTGLIPEAIYSGPLQRTLSYAQIIGDQIAPHIPVKTDNRLQELDYGVWSGLNDQEIREQFDGSDLDQWQTQGLWPTSFGGSESKIISEVFSFVDEIIVNQPQKKLSLAITSNGRLKYFLKLESNEDYSQSNCNGWRVSTGNVCLLAYADSVWRILAWNEKPQPVCSMLETKFKSLAGSF